MIEFGHDTLHDTIEIAGFVDPRSFLTEAAGEFSKTHAPGASPGRSEAGSVISRPRAFE